MLVMFPPIFVADAKIIYGYNFAAPLNALKFGRVKCTFRKIMF